MKLIDYVTKRAMVGSMGVWGLSILLAWTLMHMMIGPKRFSVADEEEPVELDIAGSTLSLAVMGLLSMCTGLALTTLSLVGTFWLLVMLILSPLLAGGIWIFAHCKAWVFYRQHKRKLREAELKRGQL